MESVGTGNGTMEILQWEPFLHSLLGVPDSGSDGFRISIGYVSIKFKKRKEVVKGTIKKQRFTIVVF